MMGIVPGRTTPSPEGGASGGLALLLLLGLPGRLGGVDEKHEQHWLTYTVNTRGRLCSSHPLRKVKEICAKSKLIHERCGIEFISLRRTPFRNGVK